MTRTFFPIIRVLLVLAVGGAPACATFGPPARDDGPATTPAGVEVSVVGQACTQVQEPDQPDNDLAEAIVEVSVRNPTQDALTVRRTDFRLVTPDGFALRTRTWGSGDPLVVNGGATQSFEMRFMARGSLQCDRELQLEARTGLLLGERSLPIGPVRFLPRRPRSEESAGVAVPRSTT
jgi:hypothetical protein